MKVVQSIPSPHFTPISINSIYSHNIGQLTDRDCSEQVFQNREQLLVGDNVLWGIPFMLGEEDNQKNNILILDHDPVTLTLSEEIQTNYLIFLHATDFKETEPQTDGIYRPMMGNPRLGEVVGEYRLQYDDRTEYVLPIKRRFQISEFYSKWGENSFECVPHTKPAAFQTNTELIMQGRKPDGEWGTSQTRTAAPGNDSRMRHWLYAVENPHPQKKLKSIYFVPQDGRIFLFGITASDINTNPLRWRTRKKFKLTLPDEQLQNDLLDFNQLDLDLGKIISISPALDYNCKSWEKSRVNKQPTVLLRSMMVEYTAHPDAILYIGTDNKVNIPIKQLENQEQTKKGYVTNPISDARRPVTVKVLDKKTGKPLAAKIHIHGEAGEYLAPVNRHRIPNPFWFEDYSVDFVHGYHYTTYIDGTAKYKLPLGTIYMEVSKGFEISPIRRQFDIDECTDEIVIELEHILPWRWKGWVTADTHVHFLSPPSALLEGEAEGVNVVNLLASQWGELFTNVGDFDGKTTLGSRENGGNGEYLLRVGTENRQHVLGHISLLGYQGQMILPLTTGGPDESALGDGIETTLTDWARKCRKQNGLSILPHFPNPRAEGAAALVLDQIDGVEMTSWDDLYSGIDPYSLSDWYRYLNCGYQVPAVGGTDKMSANTAVGTIRTYALIKNQPFTYDSWKESIRQGLAFVTYGPLIEFHINGQDMGTRIELPPGGGTVDVEWEVATVTIPVTKIELVVNGEIREERTVDSLLGQFSGSWSLNMQGSGWIALRVRGAYPDKPEMIAAHSSTVMVMVDRKPCFNAIDAMTILEQIEGSTAYVKSLGTKAEEKAYKQLLMTLTSAHRVLHNRMHQDEIYHHHTVADNHHKE